MESKRLPELGETVTVTNAFGKSSLVDVSASGNSAFEFVGDDGLKHMRMAEWRGDKKIGWNFLPKAEGAEPTKRVLKVGDRIKFIQSGNTAEAQKIFDGGDWFLVSPMELHCEAIRVDWENDDRCLGWMFHNEEETKQPSLEERIDTLSSLVREMLAVSKSKADTHCAGCPEHPTPVEEKCKVCDHPTGVGSHSGYCERATCYCLDPFHMSAKLG